MADLTKATVMSINPDSALRCVQIGDGKLKAGEALSKFDACYIKGADGLVYKAVTTVVESRTLETGATDFTEDISLFSGFAAADYAIGNAVTLWGLGAVLEYSSGMTPNAPLYASATAGKIGDARVATGDSAIARALNATQIIVVRL